MINNINKITSVSQFHYNGNQVKHLHNYLKLKKMFVKQYNNNLIK